VVKEEILEEEEKRRREREVKERRKELKVVDTKKKIKIAPKRMKEQVVVPLIRLERLSEYLTKKLELTKEVPKIKKERRMLPIPFIRLQEASIMLREYEIDYKIPKVEKSRRMLTIPIIRANFPPKISIQLTKFDTEIEKPEEIVLPKLRVPICRRMLLPSLKLLIESFDLTISEQLKERLEKFQFTIQALQPSVIEPQTRISEIGVEREIRETEPEFEVEDILGEILPILKGKGIEFSFQRPLCLIVIGKSSDGLGMVEHLMSTKYTYHGEYRFFMGLPWQKDLMLSRIAEGKLKETGVKYIPASTSIMERAKEDPYALITSERLIVHIPSVNGENIMKIIRGLKEISKRGPKCVILYAREVGSLEDLDKEVPDIDVVIAALPEYNEKLPKLIGEILGVELPPTIHETRIDNLWISAVRLYEEEVKRLDDELPTREVDFFPERESSFHYLMKRIVYWYLKEGNYAYVKAEELKPLIDEEGRFIGYIIPDIKADDEYWEVETGYPSEEERKLIKEPWNPQARLIWKLSKYEGSPKKIRVVLPAIYAHLFRQEIRKVKKYFRERGKDIKFYTIYLSQRGKIKRFL